MWSRGWKYVFNTFDYDELYDLNRDPHETENLAALSEYEDKKKEMAALMWEWILESTPVGCAVKHFRQGQCKISVSGC